MGGVLSDFFFFGQGGNKKDTERVSLIGNLGFLYGTFAGDPISTRHYRCFFLLRRPRLYFGDGERAMMGPRVPPLDTSIAEGGEGGKGVYCICQQKLSEFFLGRFFSRTGETIARQLWQTSCGREKGGRKPPLVVF